MTYASLLMDHDIFTMLCILHLYPVLWEEFYLWNKITYGDKTNCNI